MILSGISNKERQDNEGYSGTRKQGTRCLRVKILEDAALWRRLECHWYGNVTGVGQEKKTGAIYWREKPKGLNVYGDFSRHSVSSDSATPASLWELAGRENIHKT